MKQVIYRYTDEPLKQDQKLDINEEVLKLRIGNVVARKGRRWSITDIRSTVSLNTSKKLDSVTVFLSGPV